MLLIVNIISRCYFLLVILSSSENKYQICCTSVQLSLNTFPIVSRRSRQMYTDNLSSVMDSGRPSPIAGLGSTGVNRTSGRPEDKAQARRRPENEKFGPENFLSWDTGPAWSQTVGPWAGLGLQNSPWTHHCLSPIWYWDFISKIIYCMSVRS